MLKYEFFNIMLNFSYTLSLLFPAGVSSPNKNFYNKKAGAKEK